MIIAAHWPNEGTFEVDITAPAALRLQGWLWRRKAHFNVKKANTNYRSAVCSAPPGVETCVWANGPVVSSNTWLNEGVHSMDPRGEMLFA